MSMIFSILYLSLKTPDKNQLKYKIILLEWLISNLKFRCRKWNIKNLINVGVKGKRNFNK